MRAVLVTRGDLAHALHLSETRVVQLVASGVLPAAVSKASFDLVSATRKYIEYLRTERGNTSLSTERRRWLTAKANREEYELQIRQGAYIETGLIQRCLTDVFVRFRVTLMSTKAAIMREIDDKETRLRVVALVDGKIREALETLAAFNPNDPTRVQREDDEDFEPAGAPDRQRETSGMTRSAQHPARAHVQPDEKETRGYTGANQHEQKSQNATSADVAEGPWK